jgi:hypothetical protein
MIRAAAHICALPRPARRAPRTPARDVCAVADLTYPAVYPRAECACSINGRATAVRSTFVDQGSAAQNTE